MVNSTEAYRCHILESVMATGTIRTSLRGVPTYARLAERGPISILFQLDEKLTMMPF